MNNANISINYSRYRDKGSHIQNHRNRDSKLILTSDKGCIRAVTHRGVVRLKNRRPRILLIFFNAAVHVSCRENITCHEKSFSPDTFDLRAPFLHLFVGMN